MLYVSKKNIKKKKQKVFLQCQSLYAIKTKNKNITNHTMSYVVDTTYYDFIKNTVHFEYLHKLQLYRLAGYEIYYT